MNPEEEKYFQENFINYNDNSSFGSFLNMFMLQPAMDNWSNNGLAKMYSYHLEKALMTKNANISFLNNHMFGSRNLVGLIKKIPILNKLFPDKTGQIWNNGLMNKLFPNTEFFYQSKFDKQLGEGALESKYTNARAGLTIPGKGQFEKDYVAINKATGNAAEYENVKIGNLKHSVDEAKLQLDGEVIGHNINWSSKKANQTVRRLKELGITADDFSNGKMYIMKDNKRTLVDYTKENMEILLKQKTTLADDSIDVAKKASQIIHSIKAPDEVASGAKSEIVKHVQKYINRNSKMLNIHQLAKKYGNDVAKYSDEALDAVVNVMDTNTGGRTIKALKRFAKKNSYNLTQDEANGLLGTLFNKTRLQKIFSSKVGKAITQVGTGSGAFFLNIAGSVVGGIASHYQEEAIENFTRTIVDYQLAKKDDFVINDATSHSLQTHMQRSADDMEEYKKVLYYKNFSNDIRKDMSALDNNHLSADDIQTS